MQQVCTSRKICGRTGRARDAQVDEKFCQIQVTQQVRTLRKICGHTGRARDAQVDEKPCHSPFNTIPKSSLTLAQDASVLRTPALPPRKSIRRIVASIFRGFWSVEQRHRCALRQSTIVVLLRSEADRLTRLCDTSDLEKTVWTVRQRSPKSSPDHQSLIWVLT